MTIRLIVILVGVISIFSQGCSVHMALNQPEKVDIKALEKGGISRDLMISKFGTPVSSTKNQDGTRTDLYQFYEGSDPGWKYGRATFNFLADIVTLALWEIIAWPVEAAIRGDKISATATFNENDILTQFTSSKVKEEEEETTSEESEES